MMTWMSYLKDKIMKIIGHLCCMLFLSCYLLVLKNSWGSVILILIMWMTILFASLFVDYLKRSSYFGKQLDLLEELDKPYLISEVMENSYRLEDKIYRQILRTSNKSVIDKIHQLEVEQQDYKEYIEGWIHEVKLPITNIKLICSNQPSEVTSKIDLSMIQLENDVEKALYYARSDEVYKDYMIKEISLSQVLKDLIKKQKAYFIQNHISIDLEVSQTIIYTDRKWLEFILNQILINAVKYKKGETGHISFYTKEVNQGVFLYIEDQGVGIKEEELGRIFLKGFTGTNGRNQARSTGIGLYLCQKLCHKLDLQISAESKEGDYTRMILKFPKSAYLTKM